MAVRTQLILVVLIAVLGLLIVPRLRADSPAEGRYRLAGDSLTYDRSVGTRDRALIDGAIARSRARARTTVARVLGITTVKIGDPGPGVAGETRWEDGRFTMVLNLGLVDRLLGERGTDRLVMHELGHVVDIALTEPRLDSTLDLQTPRGYGCAHGTNGACAAPRERFAEGFSKWATGDIGAQSGAVLGYQIPPPSDLERWGRDLIQGIQER